MSVVTECPLLFYGKLVQEKEMQEKFWYARRDPSLKRKIIPKELSLRGRDLSRGADQNYSTYVTMIHRRYKRLQHKCSPFLQVLHKRTKCLVYKRIENPGSSLRGFLIHRTKLVIDPCKDGRYSSSAL